MLGEAKRMNFHILTLFPEMVENGLKTSIIGRAVAGGLLSIEAVNIRDFAFNKHQSVDDYPYGGGAGMLMQAEPVYLAYKDIEERIQKRIQNAKMQNAETEEQDAEVKVQNAGIQDAETVSPDKKLRVVYLSPQGKTFDQKMAEELAEYLLNNNVRCTYIHSDVDTLERVKIMDDLRQGVYDVLIGVNLLREGLDLPEVSLVAILDADKEGFLRSHRSLTQTAGRAARNVNGKVIMYADKMTDSMKLTIDETNRRREKQLAYNEANGITPQQIKKARNLSVFGNAKEADELLKERHAYVEPSTPNIAADPIVQYMSKAQMEKSIERTRKLMQEAAKKLDFIEAAQYRDEVLKMEELLKEKSR